MQISEHSEEYGYDGYITWHKIEDTTSCNAHEVKRDILPCSIFGLGRLELLVLSSFLVQ